MRVGFIAVGLVVLGLAAAPAWATPPAPTVDAERIDPLLRYADAPDLPPLPDLQPGADLPVLLRPAGPWTDAHVARLTADRVVLRLNRSGEPADVGGLRAADGPRAALLGLADEGWYVRVARPLDAAWAPTAVTGPLSEIDAVLASGPSPVDGPLGEGLTVMDVDSSIDPFHPHFFRADAGVKIWFDADEDGLLTPGIDGLDRDGDGALAADEVLHLANGRKLWTDPASGVDQVVGDDAVLDPERDWLWLDSNGNGVRDYGPEAGFDDDDPAFGEPIYVPDDVDGDGAIRVPERIVRLGSSRIVAVANGLRTYRRGEDLTDLYYVNGYRFDHGTAVGGVLVGGQLYPQPRPRGFLPEADLYLFDRSFTDEAGQLVVLDEAMEDGVDVVLWEYGRWVGDHLDGGGPVELAVDGMSADGVAQVCPAGNLATSGKHGVSEAVDGRFDFHIRFSPWSSYDYLWLDLHTDAPGAVLECELTAPTGEALDLSFDGGGEPIAGMSTWGFSWISERDTKLWTITLQSATAEPGTWVLRCEDVGSEDDRTFHAFLSDGTGWSRATRFLQESDFSTLCLPSTADSCISVAAYGGDQAYWDGEQPGERHLYSSMGPRMDGGKTIDVAAPADPFVPAPLADDEDGATHPVYRRFSGTSGAGPHVAAAVVLLRELYPDATADELRQMVRDGARIDAHVEADGEPVPGDGWGYGKLSTHRSAFGGAPAPRPAYPLDVTAAVRARGVEGVCVARAIGSVAGRADARFRWDVGYDGAWDSEFANAGHPFEVTPGEVVVLRGQASVDGWWVGGASLIWRAPDRCPSRYACSGCASTGGRSVAPLGLLILLGIRRRR